DSQSITAVPALLASGVVGLDPPSSAQQGPRDSFLELLHPTIVNPVQGEPSAQTLALQESPTWKESPAGPRINVPCPYPYYCPANSSVMKSCAGGSMPVSTSGLRGSNNSSCSLCEVNRRCSTGEVRLAASRECVSPSLHSCNITCGSHGGTLDVEMG
ncbi:hypothetical protein GOODEAATRI_031595, partial [Goodea atripinnis]